MPGTCINDLLKLSTQHLGWRWEQPVLGSDLETPPAQAEMSLLSLWFRDNTQDPAVPSLVTAFVSNPHRSTKRHGSLPAATLPLGDGREGEKRAASPQ